MREASICSRLWKFRCEDVENPSAQFRNVVDSCIPKDLPVQIKVGMYDSVPHRNNLSPRHFRVVIFQLIRQAADRLADHCQVMQDRRGHDLIIEK